MKNKIIYILTSKVKLNIKNHRVNEFIKRLLRHKIDILRIDHINYKEANIIIFKKDYEKVMKIKSIYDVNVVNTYGMLKIKRVILTNKVLLITVCIAFMILYFLSKIVFEVEVIHNNRSLRELVIRELKENNIAVYRFKKDFNKVNQIKSKILEKYNDKIEWLEIEESGTKYIIRLEERKIPLKKSKKDIQNVISKKDAIIRKIVSESGATIRSVNDYVKEGDIIISGQITLHDNIKGNVSAEGTVYGEVWYQTTVEYPFHYQEDKETGNKKNAYLIKILNNSFELSFNKYENYNYEEKTIFYNKLIPIRLVKQKQREINKIDVIYTKEMVLKKAEELAYNKVNDLLDDDEHIISQKSLKLTVKDSKIVLESFFIVYENITGYQTIVE